MTTYISFHGKSSIKNEVLTTVARKAREGFFIQGNRDRGPTAAIIGQYAPEEFEARLGLPAWMSPMLERVFDHAQEWSFRGTADSFFRGIEPGRSQEYAHYMVGGYFCMVLTPYASQLPKLPPIQRELDKASDAARIGAHGFMDLQKALAHPIGSEPFNDIFEDDFVYGREVVVKTAARARQVIASHLPSLNEEDAATASRYLKVAEAADWAYSGGDRSAAHPYAPYDLAVFIDDMKIARYQQSDSNWWDDVVRVALFKAVRLDLI